MIKQCLKCSKDFITYSSKIKQGKGKYCSRNCCDNGKILKICLACKKEFSIYPNRDKDIDRGKFCSMPCYRKSRKGKPAWNKGLQASWLIGNKHKLGKINLNPNKMFSSDNHMWKGDNVGYVAIHKWVERKLEKPTKCDNCGLDGLKGHKIHWANKNHKYLRVLKDWVRLCAKCHKAFDTGKINL